MDFCDQAAVKDLFAKYKIDALIHFAAFKAVGESVAEPLMYYRNNLDSFLNILEAARDNGSHVLFSSSATVYGEPDVAPVTEQSPRKPATSPYGNTKQMCEDFLRDCVAAYGMHGIALRYFNPIGAHPSALIGELPRGIPNNLVPFITQTAIGKRECLNVFGNDYPTPDGTCLRDFIDIVDLAKAHVCAVARMLDGKMDEPYEIFNIGTGRPVSVMELINAFQKVNGVKLNYKFYENETYKEKIKAALAAGELPDIFYTWSGSFLGDFADAGAVYCLDDVMAKYIASGDITKVMLENSSYNGKTYGVPLSMNIVTVFVNTELLKEAGVKDVPKT